MIELVRRSRLELRQLRHFGQHRSVVLCGLRRLRRRIDPFDQQARGAQLAHQTEGGERVERDVDARVRHQPAGVLSAEKGTAERHRGRDVLIHGKAMANSSLGLTVERDLEPGQRRPGEGPGPFHARCDEPPGQSLVAGQHSSNSLQKSRRLERSTLSRRWVFDGQSWAQRSSRRSKCPQSSQQNLSWKRALSSSNAGVRGSRTRRH